MSHSLRQTLKLELASARAQTDSLFDMLAPSAMYDRPIPERHRIVFYLGHVEAFDWNMICHTSFGAAPFNSEFDRLFAFGIDPVGGKLPADQPADWPGIDEINSYRERVRRTVDDFLDRSALVHAGEPFVENGQIFHVATEHRLMHAETLAYMLHWLPFEKKRGMGGQTADSWTSEFGVCPPIPRSVEIPAGEAALGLATASAFGWDNEFDSQTVLAPAFSIDAFNVTNGQFLDFIQAGGYKEQSFWSGDDWQWVQTAGVRCPKFWIQRSGAWCYRTMFDEVPLPRSWPVYVSHAEAEAYARWAGKSLPTEAQYHRAAFGFGDSVEPLHGNFGFQSWNPHSVGASSGGQGPFGVFDLVGNGWEWTGTTFAPFPGFKPFPFYPGYSADFFDGKHFVMKGASPRTAALLVRPSFRNWFQPHYPNVYATFRCVEN